MPYLNYLYCEDCGFPAKVDVDYIRTIESYIADGRKSATIDNSTLVWDYLIYTCGYCHKEFRYTFRNVEERVRTFLSSLSRAQQERINEVAEAQNNEVDRLSGKYFIEKAADRVQKMYSD